jgi:hypothetical protein
VRLKTLQFMSMIPTDEFPQTALSANEQMGYVVAGKRLRTMVRKANIAQPATNRHSR